MKRFVSLVLSVCFLFSINTVSYAANTSSRKASNPVIQSMNDKYHVDFSGMSIDRQKQEPPCQRTVPPTTSGHRTYSSSSLSDSSLLNVAPTADSAAGVGVEVADWRSRAASCSGVTLAVRTISLTSAASAS